MTQEQLADATGLTAVHVNRVLQALQREGLIARLRQDKPFEMLRVSTNNPNPYYLRFAVALAGLIGSVVLTLQYFLLLPPFAWISKRAARRAPEGWVELDPDRGQDLRGQF